MNIKELSLSHTPKTYDQIFYSLTKTLEKLTQQLQENIENPYPIEPDSLIQNIYLLLESAKITLQLREYLSETINENKENPNSTLLKEDINDET